MKKIDRRQRWESGDRIKMSYGQNNESDNYSEKIVGSSDTVQ